MRLWIDCKKNTNNNYLIRAFNMKTIISGLVLVGFIAVNSINCERINLRPYVIDPPKDDIDKMFVQYVSD